MARQDYKEGDEEMTKKQFTACHHCKQAGELTHYCETHWNMHLKVAHPDLEEMRR
jgi:hypothetical protein